MTVSSRITVGNYSVNSMLCLQFTSSLALLRKIIEIGGDCTAELSRTSQCSIRQVSRFIRVELRRTPIDDVSSGDDFKIVVFCQPAALLYRFCL